MHNKHNCFVNAYSSCVQSKNLYPIHSIQSIHLHVTARNIIRCLVQASSLHIEAWEESLEI